VGKNITDVSKLSAHGLPIAGSSAAAELYKFRVPSSYLELINPLDIDDPIKKLIIPHDDELMALRTLDPTDEAANTQVPGLQHKFPDTALLLVTKNCAGYCRYCFRKRIFQPHSDEVPRSLDSALAYIREHSEINNVILSGGDALFMPTTKLLNLLKKISDIDSVRVIRIGSKMPAFDPVRITGDDELLRGIEQIGSTSNVQIYLMAHFDHPREVTTRSRMAIRALARAGVSCLNQCPLLNGVNSGPGVMSELFSAMEFIGCPQYYVFHCRPTDGNAQFTMPLRAAFDVFEREMRFGSGLSKTARYCIAHPRAKLQVVSILEGNVLIKILQACDVDKTGMFIFHPIDSSPDDLVL
jgi:lysine 2,3-aminomutase